MVEHKITVGLSTIHKCGSSFMENLPVSKSGGILDYLISTPVIMAMIIEAATELLDPLLPEEYITVGKNIELSHDKPTVIDGTVNIVLTVTKIDGDRISLDVSGHDAIGQICRGKYERVIVNQSVLTDSAYRRAHSAEEKQNL